MLTHRRTQFLFAKIVIVLLLLDWQFGLPWWAYLLALLAYISIVAWGSYSIRSGFFMKTTCLGPPEKNAIAITFDDGPLAAYTPKVLGILEAHDVKAAFFCIGHRIQGNEALLKKMVAEGHLVGNHSFSHHFWFDLFSKKKMVEDLLQASEAIEKATGLRPAFFRPPYGVINPNLKSAIESCGFHTIGWSIRSLDTVVGDKEKLMQRVMDQLKPGAIVLFHDHGKMTLEILPEFIRAARAKGLRIVPLDELLNIEPYAY
ncbi:MAG: polysaccharide deacetylase family protein [Saprospiraceae bacterium]